MSSGVRVVLVPGVLALLPEYSSLEDPVPALRAACLAAVRWLGAGPVGVLGDAQGVRVAEALLAEVFGEGGLEAQARGAFAPQPPEAGAYLVVGNGSARRSERAPGYLDERAAGFDDALREALLRADVSGVDRALGEELLASLDGILRLGEVVEPGTPATLDYDDDPYGVQYWVVRWGG